MALGQAFKLGVWFPLMNSSFRYPCYRKVILNANYISGDTLTVAYGGSLSDRTPGHDLVPYSDYLTLGPSTYSGNTGFVERQLVKSVSVGSDNISLVLSNPDYDYNSGDPIAWMGTNFPGGWDAQGGGVVDLAGLTFAIVQGKDDNYSLRMVKSGSTAAALYVRMGSYDGTLAEILPLPEPSVVYYVGCYYKAGSISNTVLLSFDSCFTSDIDLTLTTQSSWVVTSGIRTTKAASAAVVPTIYFKLDTTATAANLDVDCLWMCHASGTSGSASGYYGMGTPDLGSISWSFRRMPRYAMLMNGTSVGHVLGGDDMKYSISATFTNISQVVVDNLRKFLGWQNRGNLLCLETGLEDLPPWLVGRLELRFSKPNFDLSVSTAQLKFVEI